MARLEQSTVLQRFNPASIEVVTGVGSAIDLDPVVLACRVLDHDDGVSAGREWSAGHDFDGLARSDHVLKNLSSPNFADNFQFARGVSGADRVAVACGAGKRRIIAIGRNGFGKDTSWRGEDRDLLRR